MRLPDFIIGGAPRCGTTWLYHLLSRHPRVHMAAPLRPEPKFFLVDDLYARGLGYYSATWFAGAPAGSRCGEKSTNYLESANAALRIRHDLPSVRMVFMLRDPAARAWSNYLWSRMNGAETESFERALEFEQQRERTRPADQRFSRPYAYFSRGLYADLLQPWHVLFPREQILCVRFEEILQHPGAVAERLHRFLDVPVRPQDVEGLGPVNVSDAAPVPREVRAWLSARYAEANRKLYALLGAEFGTWS